MFPAGRDDSDKKLLIVWWMARGDEKLRTTNTELNFRSQEGREYLGYAVVNISFMWSTMTKVIGIHIMRTLYYDAIIELYYLYLVLYHILVFVYKKYIYCNIVLDEQTI